MFFQGDNDLGRAMAEARNRQMSEDALRKASERQAEISQIAKNVREISASVAVLMEEIRQLNERLSGDRKTV